MNFLRNALLRLAILFMLNTLSGKEKEMMALLYAQRIMNGKLTYVDVPRLLKDKVAEILIESGMPELIGE